MLGPLSTSLTKNDEEEDEEELEDEPQLKKSTSSTKQLKGKSMKKLCIKVKLIGMFINCIVYTELYCIVLHRDGTTIASSYCY